MPDKFAGEPSLFVERRSYAYTVERPKLDGPRGRIPAVNARIAALTCASLFACRSTSTPVPEARADEPPGGAGGIAVVELFTSEGCSSCPPADEVLGDLSRRSDGPIYALGFHVDYWDNLGWPDRAASPDNTARQKAYAHAFGTGASMTALAESVVRRETTFEPVTRSWSREE